MNSDPVRTAAVFDLDGTLTVRDTTLPFLRFAAPGGCPPWLLAREAPLMLLDVARALLPGDVGKPEGVLGRSEHLVHERLTRRCLAGMEWEGVRARGEAFASECMDAFLREGALARVRWHLGRGHTCVLVSASLDVYVRPWGVRSGFQHVAATELVVDDGRVSGVFRGPLCWGSEKVRRVEALLGDLERWQLHVYGNGPGDRQLLRRATHAMRVRPGTDLTPEDGRALEGRRSPGGGTPRGTRP